MEATGRVDIRFRHQVCGVRVEGERIEAGHNVTHRIQMLGLVTVIRLPLHELVPYPNLCLHCGSKARPMLSLHHGTMEETRGEGPKITCADDRRNVV